MMKIVNLLLCAGVNQHNLKILTAALTMQARLVTVLSPHPRTKWRGTVVALRVHSTSLLTTTFKRRRIPKHNPDRLHLRKTWK